MKKIIPIPSLLLSLGLATAPLQAETLVVLPGTSIQAKIDEAADGDIIAIFGGVYSEPEIRINKAVRLVELQGQDVTLQGNLIVTDAVTNAPPLEGLTFNNNNQVVFQSTGSVIVRNCNFTAGGAVKIEPPVTAPSVTEVLVEGLEGCSINMQDDEDRDERGHPMFQASIRDVSNCSIRIFRRGSGRTGSTFEATNSQILELEHNSGSLNVRHCEISGYSVTRAAKSCVVSDTKLSSFESDRTVYASVFRITSDQTISFYAAEKAVLAYSEVLGQEQGDNGGRAMFASGDSTMQIAVVGNKIRRMGRNYNASALRIAGNVDATINNNKIWGGISEGDDSYYSEVINVENFSDDSRLIVKNNFLHLRDRNGGSHYGYCLRIRNSSEGDVKMLNNVCFNDTGGLIMSNLGPAVEGNVMFGGGSLLTRGGVVADPNTNTHYSDQLDPGYPGWSGNWRLVAPDAANMFELTADAIVRDAGSSNPLYNDRDGSQNDAGPSGGAWYDPEGWTTDKPVVIGFDLTPELLLEGVNGEVTIKNGKSISAP